MGHINILVGFRKKLLYITFKKADNCIGFLRPEDEC